MALTQVSSKGIKNATILDEDIATGTITAASLGTNCVGTAELQNSAVETINIQDQAVALSKLPHGDSNNDGKFLRANNGADPSFESLPASGVTVSNNTNNRVVTGDGTNLNAEANLTFNGTDLDVLKGNSSIRLQCSNETPTINFNANNLADAARIKISESSSGGVMQFLTKAAGGSLSENLRIHKEGTVSIGNYGNAIANLFSQNTALIVQTPTDGGSSGIYIKSNSQQGGTASPQAGLRIAMTSAANSASQLIGADIVASQSLLQETYGIKNIVTASYSATYGIYTEMNKSLGAYTNGYMHYMNLKPTSSGGTAYFLYCVKDNSNLKARILQNGNIQNANNSYGSTSDVKLKENIVDAKSQWDDIKALKVRNFNFKDDPDKVKMLGVVAQEAEAVSAGLIETENNIEVDETTKEGKVVGTTKFVKYSILYMKAVKALQEAQARIETLETKVATLEAA
jgi:hypothetical protein